MSGLKITLLQQPLVWMDGPANLRHFDRQLELVSGRDVIVLPEMFTTGFAMEAANNSLSQDSVITWMQAKARQTDALIAGSAALQTERGAVNRFLLVEPEGKVHLYDKRHLFRMADEHQHYAAGDKRIIVQWRGWRILPLICYDLRFPIWSRNRNDYDLALYVANWPAPRSLHWQTLLTARAIENQAYVAGCNRVGTDGNGLHYR
ncbi:amidohydrolase, partial [Salmonella enterica]|nr:amidohydrolase [Salmonella enterica]ELF3959053.1 amidohydrolase [Salmonella enterica]